MLDNKFTDFFHVHIIYIYIYNTYATGLFRSAHHSWSVPGSFFKVPHIKAAEAERQNNPNCATDSWDFCLMEKIKPFFLKDSSKVNPDITPDMYRHLLSEDEIEWANLRKYFHTTGKDTHWKNHGLIFLGEGRTTDNAWVVANIFSIHDADGNGIGTLSPKVDDTAFLAFNENQSGRLAWNPLHHLTNLDTDAHFSVMEAHAKSLNAYW